MDYCHAHHCRRRSEVYCVIDVPQVKLSPAGNTWQKTGRTVRIGVSLCMEHSSQLWAFDECEGYGPDAERIRIGRAETDR